MVMMEFKCCKYSMPAVSGETGCGEGPTPNLTSTSVVAKERKVLPQTLHIHAPIACLIIITYLNTMPESIINESDLALDRYDGNIFVLTMRKAPVSSISFQHCISITID